MSNIRLRRAQSQKLYVRSFRKIYDNLWTFKVEGSTGKLYDLTFEEDGMSCNCFDCRTRDMVCKHLYFIIYRLAGFNPKTSANIRFKLENNIFKKMDFTTMLEKRIQLFTSVTYGLNEEETDEEECCICFESMKETQNLKCIQCKHLFHKDCLQRCIDKTCPLCRSGMESLILKLDSQEEKETLLIDLTDEHV